MEEKCLADFVNASRRPARVAECILDPGVEDELWANRVIEAAFQTFKNLAANSRMGRPRRFRNARLRDIRSRSVSGFDNYLIFYRCIPRGVQVLHVYHGARDIEMLFDEE